MTQQKSFLTEAQKTFLNQHPLLKSLTLKQKEAFFEKIGFQTINDKSLIYKPSDDTKSMFLIQKGKIKTEIISGEGKVLIKRIALAGDFFGEQQLYGLSNRNEFAWPIGEPLHLFVIKVADLKMLMRESFDFTESIFSIIASQIANAEKRVHTFSLQQARFRIIDFLKEMVNKEGRQFGFEWLIRHHLTQEEIGSYTGTGRQAVTETLSKFKQKNIIHYSRGKVLIRDLNLLK